jgi:WASH complex subunit strumpellin
MGKCTKLFAVVADSILKIGQMQLLRRKIAYELHNSAKFDSKHLLHALETFNASLIGDIEAHFKDQTKPYPDEDNPLLYELNPYLESVGLSEPLKKIYLITNSCEFISTLLCLFVLSQLSKLQYVKLIGKSPALTLFSIISKYLEFHLS